MLSSARQRKDRQRAAAMLRRAGIVLTRSEMDEIEVTDFGLGLPESFGLQVVVYVNTERVCAKELVLFPWQICPEHRHPRVDDDLGKEETFRCRWGEVYLYVPGPATVPPHARIPQDRARFFTVRHEVVLQPGGQFTLPPDTLHWFQAGPTGAIVSEFSAHSTDQCDVFTDPSVIRVPSAAKLVT